MNKYYIAAFLAVVLTTCAQLLLKYGANRSRGRTVLKQLLHPAAITGYILFLGVALLNLFALQKIKLIEMVFILPMNYILIVFLSRLVFKEAISKQQLLGFVFIILGIIFFNINTT